MERFINSKVNIVGIPFWNRDPQYIDRIGTVVEVPSRHVVWFKIRFDDDSVVAFKSSSLRTLNNEVLTPAAPIADNNNFEMQPLGVVQDAASDIADEGITSAGSTRPRRERKARSFDLSRDNGGDFSKVSTSPRTPLGTSMYRGVSYIQASRKWKSAITVNALHIHLGSFQDEIEAAKVIERRYVT